MHPFGSAHHERELRCRADQAKYAAIQNSTHEQLRSGTVIGIPFDAPPQVHANAFRAEPGRGPLYHADPSAISTEFQLNGIATSQIVTPLGARSI